MRDQEIGSAAELLSVCSRRIADSPIWFRGLGQAYPKGELVPAAF